ncbi:hypothetical protein [Streptomyces sp. WMMB303]|uniref:hypothetical protein n=1 Tax=Streptomyces sp. WMMB303 TaxID=3034154 RepID=UPI0023ECFF48|nr:hypothetical protein [Streptomyces sp. WMMB303]MDF4249294.1 hypothetical protein [Streptomyces sp. WMMB303]
MRAGTDGALDVLHPLLVLGRGACHLAAKGRNWWLGTPRERRGPTMLAVAACGVLLWLLPYGPFLAGFALLGSTAWYGRRQAGPAPPRAAPTDTQRARLQALYEALVPYLAPPGAAPGEPLYASDGGWERAFEEFAFRDGRISGLLLRYPTSFRDSEPAERLRLERLLAAKTGRGREYRFCWDEECNLLEMTALEPLPGGIRAQPFETAPDEAVLGFTDGDETSRTLPAHFPGEDRADEVPAAVWRTGSRSTEPHLLAVGTPGAGTSTLLRSLALQALGHGEVLLVDGDGGGGFAAFAARRGVLGVESTLPGALAALEWAARETERRLLAASRSRQHGTRSPGEAPLPLCVLVDRPALLSHLARSRGLADPQELLRTPLRHGRAAGVTVAVAEQFDGLDELTEAVLAGTRARVVLGAVTPGQAGSVLGRAPQTGPAAEVPRGRGFARLGDGPVLRLQVPATPDPGDESADEAERTAVRELLPASVRSPHPAAAAEVAAAAHDAPRGPAGPVP